MSDPNAFETVHSATVWGLAAPFMALGFYYLYHRVQLRLSSRQLAGIGVLWFTIGAIPFVTYVLTGISWTGLQLSEIHRTMIESKHMIVLFAWLTTGLIQMGAISVGARKVHSWLGNLGQNILLPVVLIELGTNAVFVFLPDKPVLLAAALLERQPTLVEAVGYTFCFTVALCTPVYMALYGWLSHRALQDRQYALHGIYMALVVVHSIGPGILRAIIRGVFVSSGCLGTSSKTIVLVVQSISFNWEVLVRGLASAFPYGCIPLSTRQKDAWVRKSFGFLAATHVISLGASFWFLVPMAMKKEYQI